MSFPRDNCLFRSSSSLIIASGRPLAPSARLPTLDTVGRSGGRNSRSLPAGKLLVQRGAPRHFMDRPATLLQLAPGPPGIRPNTCMQ